MPPTINGAYKPPRKPRVHKKRTATANPGGIQHRGATSLDPRTSPAGDKKALESSLKRAGASDRVKQRARSRLQHDTKKHSTGVRRKLYERDRG